MLPKAILVAVSVAFCAGAAVVTVPSKPRSFAPEVRVTEPIECLLPAPNAAAAQTPATASAAD